MNKILYTITLILGWIMLILVAGVAGGISSSTIPLARGFIEALGCIGISKGCFTIAKLLK